MGYRDDAEAMRVRIETLELELARARRHADDADAEVAELRLTITRLRAGLRDEETLRTDRHLLASEALLPIAGVLGALVTVAAATVFSPYEFQGELQLDARGVANFLVQLADGGLATLLVTAAALPLAVLPSVASVGMHMRKRFGWYAATLAWTLWALVCPPLGVYGLYALLRPKVRELFFVEAMKVPRPVRVATLDEEEGPAPTHEYVAVPTTDEVVRRSQQERLARARERRSAG
ncbi:MAG: hypothetical protein KF729_00275 [Sandaracinaceae bacterium]|nr:hypothetical protein [Sandaracinaceae bacterium]